MTAGNERKPRKTRELRAMPVPFLGAIWEIRVKEQLLAWEVRLQALLNKAIEIENPNSFAGDFLWTFP
jgi:hypothetical protein